MTSAHGPGPDVSGRAPSAGGFPLPFGSYLLLRAFARGGMGEVYLGKVSVAPGHERYCVLKKLRPELTKDQEYVRRFIDEARIVVQLHHPNIAHVFDVGRVGEEYYLAMEYVSGRDVRTVQDRSRDRDVALPVPTVLHLLCEVLEALDYAHRRTHPVTGEPLNLIHRDVSPQNVMVSFDGAVKLIDFGLASSKLKMERTQPNVVMGKMAYMAPEQARGEAIDSRVDLFAAGVLGYELLVGERYYEGMSAHEIWSVVGRGDFVPRKWKTIEPELAKILYQGLHPKADKRFPTGSEFRQALLHYLDRHHPGTGPEHLSALVGDLFPEEIQRELEMLRGFTLLDSDTLSESLEASRSMSVSLAHADFVGGGPTQLDGNVPGSRVVHDELSSQDTESAERTHLGAAPTPSGDAIYQAPTMLDGVLPAAQLARERRPTPPTGTLAQRGLVGRAEHTEVVRRAPGLEPAGRRKTLPIAAAVAAALVVAASVAVLAGRGEEPAVAPAVPTSLATPGPADRAPREPPDREGATQTPPEPPAVVRAEAREPLPAPEPAAAPEPPSEPPADEPAPEEPSLAAASEPAHPADKGSSNDDRTRRPKVRRPPKESPPPKPRPRADTRSTELLRKSPRERVNLILQCNNPCRKKVLDEYTKLQFKEQNAPQSEKLRARKEFNDVWAKCYRRCH